MSTDNMPDVKALLESTGIKPVEFKDLAGVSTPMVYKWLKGSKAHPLRLTKLAKLNEVLTAIREDGGLPLSSEVPNKERLGIIKSLLVKQLRTSS